MEDFTEFAKIIKSGNVQAVKDVLFGKSSLTIKNLNLHDEYGFTPLCHACMKHGKVEIVKMLIAAGASVDYKSTDDETPLYMATYNNHCDIVQELLNGGARVDERNTPEQETALNCAARLGYVPIATLLIERGANLNAKTSFGETPLFQASEYNRLEMVFLLLTKNADKSIVDRDGHDALYIAGEREHKDVAKLLKANKDNLKTTKVEVDREISNRRPSMMTSEQIAFKLQQKKEEEAALQEITKIITPATRPKASTTNKPKPVVVPSITAPPQKSAPVKTVAKAVAARTTIGKTVVTATQPKQADSAAPKSLVSSAKNDNKPSNGLGVVQTLETEESDEKMFAPRKVGITLEEAMRMGLNPTPVYTTSKPRAKGPRVGGTQMVAGAGTDQAAATENKKGIVSTLIGSSLDFSSAPRRGSI